MKNENDNGYNADFFDVWNVAVNFLQELGRKKQNMDMFFVSLNSVILGFFSAIILQNKDENKIFLTLLGTIVILINVSWIFEKIHFKNAVKSAFKNVESLEESFNESQRFVTGYNQYRKGNNVYKCDNCPYKFWKSCKKNLIPIIFILFSASFILIILHG